MKVLFSSLPAYGHIFPLIPLALAAQEAGHQVTYATTADFHACLRAFGLQPAAAGTSFSKAFAEAQTGLVSGSLPRPDQTRSLKGKMFGYTFPRAFVESLRPLLHRLRPDLLVHESGNVGAFLAAKIANVPGVCHGFGRVGSSDELEGDPMACSARNELAEYAKQLGVVVPPEFSLGYGDPYLDVCPPSLQNSEVVDARNRIPLRPVPVNEPHETPYRFAEFETNRPIVYLTLGTVWGQADVLRCAIFALSTLDVNVLVATGPRVDAAALSDVPSNVRVEPWVPQAAVLSRMALIVHHGGGGTALGALHAGVPQLLLLQDLGQNANAKVLTSVGAGDYIVKAELSAEAVAAKAKRLLTDGAYREAACDISREIAAMPGPEDVLRSVEALLEN